MEPEHDITPARMTTIEYSRWTPITYADISHSRLHCLMQVVRQHDSEALKESLLCDAKL